MSDLFGNIVGGVSDLLGIGDTKTGNFLSGLGNLAGGAYSLYQGINAQNQQQDYLNSLYASQGLSDEILRAQYERAQDLYYPIEDLQAQYALDDLQRTRDLQLAQQDYSIDKGMSDIDFATGTMDPLQYGLLTQLSEGAPAQKYMDIASTDVNQAFNQAQNEAARSFARQGINPNSGAMQNMLSQMAISKGSALAGARTNASRMAEDLDLSRKQQALNYWSGVPFNTTSVDTSGSALANQAAGGFQSAANTLAKSAALTGQTANDAFAGASAAFGNIGGYLNPSTQQKTTTVNSI